MAADLDRAYVINGDDLRIALTRTMTLGDPRERAALILGEIEVRGAVTVSRERLARALDGQWVYARNRDGTHHAQVADADNVAGDLMEKLAEQKAQQSDPWAPDDDVVDAHIHCEHAPASRAAYELEQADQIVTLLGRMPDRHVKRVLTYVWDYLTDGDAPPF